MKISHHPPCFGIIVINFHSFFQGINRHIPFILVDKDIGKSEKRNRVIGVYLNCKIISIKRISKFGKLQVTVPFQNPDFGLLRPPVNRHVKIGQGLLELAKGKKTCTPVHPSLVILRFPFNKTGQNRDGFFIHANFVHGHAQTKLCIQVVRIRLQCISEHLHGIPVTFLFGKDYPGLKPEF
ncbi:MAG: hypothetical protein BWY05_01288 [Euryarchaeota archaeon ADurb.Bin165]|nr:MAG: hypothetical protein BWY05_01288 [Euryarchaeota archaeon ADurb.Bin165]